MKSFTEEKRKKIVEKLFMEGKLLFQQYGIKKTNIRELAASVGIAPGTFYQFFRSKEELYFRILEKEELKIKTILLEKYSGSEPNEETLNQFLLDGIELVLTNDFMKKAIIEGDIQNMVQQLSQDVLEQHMAEDEHLLIPMLKKWKISGSNQQLKLFSSVLRALFMLVTHQKEIGEDHFRYTIEFYTKAISAQIFKERKTK